eukprot:scaffold23599_cov26-Tisochrysis_lutea.AAC.1
MVGRWRRGAMGRGSGGGRGGGGWREGSRVGASMALKKKRGMAARSEARTPRADGARGAARIG